MSAGVFPLYENIVQTIQNKPLSNRQIKTMINKIQKFDEVGCEYLFTLIRYHQLKNNHQVYNHPYQCQIKNDKMIFDISKLPEPLPNIIYKFTLLHTKKK